MGVKMLETTDENMTAGELELVDAGLMQKTDEDTIEDFIDVYDFSEAFAPELVLSENTF